MDEEEAPTHRPPPPFVEVKCESSGMRRRFAMGTEAGFAVSVINSKLGDPHPLSLHIEAFKEGEEPITFGPNSLLVDYGPGWTLHTVTQLPFSGGEGVVRPKPMQVPHVMGSDNLHAAKGVPRQAIDFMNMDQNVSDSSSDAANEEFWDLVNSSSDEELMNLQITALQEMGRSRRRGSIPGRIYYCVIIYLCNEHSILNGSLRYELKVNNHLIVCLQLALSIVYIAVGVFAAGWIEVSCWILQEKGCMRC